MTSKIGMSKREWHGVQKGWRKASWGSRRARALICRNDGSRVSRLVRDYLCKGCQATSESKLTILSERKFAAIEAASAKMLQDSVVFKDSVACE